MVNSAFPIIWNTWIGPPPIFLDINYHIDIDRRVRVADSRALRRGAASLLNEEVPDRIYINTYDLRQADHHGMLIHSWLRV